MKIKWLSLAAIAIAALGGLGYMAISASGGPIPLEHDGPSLVSDLRCPGDSKFITADIDPIVRKDDPPSTPETALARFLAQTYPRADVGLFVKVGQDLEAAVFQVATQAKAVAETIHGKWYLTSWAVCESTAQKWGAQ